MTAIFCVVFGLYCGLKMATSTTNYVYLVDKLMKGLLIGLCLCVAFLAVGMTVFQSKFVQPGTWITTLIVFALASVYLSYTLVYVVRPSNAKGENDDIWGVLMFYVFMFMMIGLAIIFCCAKCNEQYRVHRDRR